MLEKFSVKKPFTILVMVVAILILGVVSLTSMTTDLLPEISLPYMLVITTYPGASPEKVETQVCEPMESALGTITGVKNVYSMSYENYGIVELEFVDGTDMDSTMVKVSSAIDTVEPYLPEECGTPNIMEISTDMMASVYLAASLEDKTIEETSRFVEDYVIPRLERQEGVTRVTSIGLVEDMIQVELNKEKVDLLNDKILAKANDAFADAMEQLDDAREKLEKNENKLKDSKKELVDGAKELEESKQKLLDSQKELDDSKQELKDNEQKLADGRAEIAANKQQLEEGKEKLAEKKEETAEQLAETERQLLTAKTDLEAAKTHISTEIAMAGQTNAALQTYAEQCRQGISKLDNLLQMFSTILPIADEADYAVKSAMLSQIPGLTLPPAATVTAADIAVINGALTGKEDEYKSQRDDLKKQKADLEARINENTTMIAAYQAQLPEIENNIAQVDYGLEELYKGNLTAAIEISSAQNSLTLGEMQIATAESQLDASQKQIDAGWDQLKAGQEQIDAGWDSLEDAKKQIQDGWDSLAEAEEQIQDGWNDYADAVENYEKQKKEALRHANADQLISLDTLAGLIYAQNFAMPAGYVDDRYDNSWLVKVGTNFSNVEELKKIVLTNIDDIGDVRLRDIADITVINNAEDSYARLDGRSAVILSVFKSSTSGTNEVSKTVMKAVKEMQEENDGLSVVTLMDQGDYITMIINGVLQSMILGAGLAIIVLAIFLKDIKPTIVVAVSIPLSVLTAIVLIYFTDITLNIMSLSGLALGIGMLVDNSIVVIENIYRLRSKGVGAARAAVQGTRQVAGAIIASTLTTVSVFAPMVFTNGMVRDLMTPISLTIIYTLMASLLIAMTVVPATGSTILKNTKPKDHPWFDKIQDAYGSALAFCLRVKIVPLAIAIALLSFSIWQVVRMGIVMIPDMTSNQIQINIEMPEDTDKATCYARADEIMEKILQVEGVASVGAMSGGDTALFVSADTGNDFDSYSFMVITENEKAGEKEVKKICKDIEKATEDIDCTLTISTGLSEMGAILGSGLAIKIYGDDLDTLKMIAGDIKAMAESMEGYEKVSDGLEEADQVIHLTLDKDAAMRNGLTVAQIFADINSKISAEKRAATVTIDGVDMDIIIKDNMIPLTKENLMNYTFEVKKTDDDNFEYTEDIPLSAFAKTVMEDGVTSINRENQSRVMTVSASIKEGYNATLLGRKLQPMIDAYELPAGYLIDTAGESDSVNIMVIQMVKVMLMGLAFIYLVMVAQFQSLLSPFIVLFTVPLAFTGGLIGLLLMKEPLSVMGMMGFVILLGTVVNNGIVFVDYANQLRLGGLERREALIATGKTRMRPILMTAMTTILAMTSLMFGDDLSNQMGRGMAIVIAGGLAYATLMTLFIIPVMYDILFKRKPILVDIGSEDLNDIPDDAADYIREKRLKEKKAE